MNFQPLTEYLNSLNQTEKVPCLSFVLCQDHRVLYRHLTGNADHTGQPLTDRHVFWVYSGTKLLTAVAILQLWERGKLALDDPVSRYLPAYAALSNSLQIKHLLTMTGGLSYDIHSPSLNALLRENPECTTRQVAEAIAGDPLRFSPGSHFLYSLSADVLGAVCEAAGDMEFADYLDQNILIPLGMADSSMRPGETWFSRMAQQYVYDPDTDAVRENPEGLRNHLILSSRFVSGGAGLISNPGDYIRLADALACGGISREGYRLLGAPALELLSRNHLSGQALADYQTSRQTPEYGYGFCVRTRLREGADGIPAGEFGWDGVAGFYTAVDPVHHISAAYAQHIIGHTPAVRRIHPTLLRLVYQCMGLSHSSGGSENQT